MSEVKIIGVMRVKNEERWMGSCLQEATKLCDQILVLDDGSTDSTPEICRSFAKVKCRFYQRTVDEVRDRQELLQWALENRADWVLILDGDEVLEKCAAETIRCEISRLDPRDPVYTFFYLHILYFWNDPAAYRCEDSIYGNFWIPRLFTTWGQDAGRLFIGSTGHGHNLHGSGVPSNLLGKGRKIDVKVKHYGYLDAVVRQKKFDFYLQHDPGAAAVGYYDHLTSEKGMSLARWTDRSGEQICPGLFIKPVGYYQFARPEVAALVPAPAKRILDVGCGQGSLGVLLKEQEPQREVVGVELDQMSASAAAGKLDKVLVGNIEKMNLDYPVGYFDCIIFADILEHLYNPWDTLLYLKRFLHPQGCMVISLPNVKNLTLIDQLLNKGRWLYQEAGILDRGHLRFFTVQDAQEMLASCNMKPDYIIGVPDPAVPDLSPNLELNKLVLKNLTPVEINELRTVQMLIRANPCIPLDPPGCLVSIVIPTYNQYELTKLCLASIEQNTDVNHDIIIVDNGSSKETSGYLAALKKILLIRNSKNLGFAAACNQGLVASRGEYICLLNNDTIVTRGWLTHLVHHLEATPGALAVGPVSNHAPDGQLLQVELQSFNDIESIAHNNRINNWLQASRTNFLSGFCLLLKADAKEIIGGLDTMYWPGNFEDDDYCLRIKLAGYELLIARDVYIHHFGGQTFSGQKLDYDQSMEINWLRFKKKWNLPEDFNPVHRRSLAEQLKSDYSQKELFIPLVK